MTPKKVAKLALSGLLVASVGLIALFFFPQLVGLNSFVVTSGSMEPHIPTGSAIWTRSVDPTSIEEQDIITFETNSATVTHRVVGIQNRSGKLLFQTQGDASEQPDLKPVASEQVRGRLAFSAPYVGLGLLGLSSPLGTLTLVAISSILLVILNLNDVYNELGQSRRTAETVLLSSGIVMMLASVAGFIGLLPLTLVVFIFILFGTLAATIFAVQKRLKPKPGD